jgi:RNA polymerase sigma-70 factor (ECF subfamily)
VALVRGLRKGDLDAYQLLVERFERPVYNLVYRLIGHAADAEDVVQEVFLKVFRNVDRFRGHSSLKTWIYRIAVNEARNRRRWFRRHAFSEVGLEEEPSQGLRYEQMLEDGGPSPLESAMDREARRMIEEALDGLSAPYRSAVVLRDIEDLSYEQIGETLQISLGTVKSRIRRGREALRRRLAGRLEGAAPMAWTPQPAE